MFCSLKAVPPELAIEAAQTAVRINPNNASPPVAGLAALLPPERLALLTSRRWGPKVRLGVSFPSGTAQSVRTKVLTYANKWGEFGDIRFLDSAQGEVRLSFGSGGYWSYLGTDILSIRGVTMNLQGFDRGTLPESEWDRVVVHEFGHTLGFPHEHERQEIIDRLDFEKTVAYFMRTQGWSRQDVINQVLSPEPAANLTVIAGADERSIMCYTLPGSITKNGQAIPGGSVLTETDKRSVGSFYPLDTPPPPPPPPVNTLEADVVAAVRKAGYTVTKGSAGGPGEVTEAELREVLQRAWGSVEREGVPEGSPVAEIILLVLPYLLEWLKNRK